MISKRGLRHDKGYEPVTPSKCRTNCLTPTHSESKSYSKCRHPGCLQSTPRAFFRSWYLVWTKCNDNLFPMYSLCTSKDWNTHMDWYIGKMRNMNKRQLSKISLEACFCRILLCSSFVRFRTWVFPLAFIVIASKFSLYDPTRSWPSTVPAPDAELYWFHWQYPHSYY